MNIKDLVRLRRETQAPLSECKEALEEMREKDVFPKLRGILLKERGIPRHGNPVFFQGEEVATVTSGSLSPVLDAGIALAYLPRHVKKGSMVEVGIRKKRVAAEVVKTPFVK